MSSYSLQKPEFVDELLAVVTEFAIPLDKICLEISEKAVAQNTPQELESLARLNIKGIELALGDFGQDQTSEHWKLCSELGCDEAQGFYLSKPISAKDLLAWMANWKVQTD